MWRARRILEYVLVLQLIAIIDEGRAGLEPCRIGGGIPLYETQFSWGFRDGHGMESDMGKVAKPLADALDVNDDVLISSGTLSASSYDIAVGGDWTNQSTFIAGTSSVDFDIDSVDNAIYGSTNFYNLSITTGTAKTVSFESAQTQTITGTLALPHAE